MAESPKATSVLSKTEITYEELVQSTLQKLLYLVHGTGRDRDRTIQLSTLRKWVLEGVNDAAFDNLSVATKIDLIGSPASTNISRGSVTTSTATASSVMNSSGLTVDGTIGQATKTTEVANDSVTITGGTNVATLEKNNLKFEDSNSTATLTKNGLVSTTSGTTFEITKDRVETAKYRATSFIETTTNYTSLPKEQLLSGNDKKGDIEYIWNKGTSAIDVNIAEPYASNAKKVVLNPGCVLGFMCVGEADAQYKSEWAPMANVQIY